MVDLFDGSGLDSHMLLVANLLVSFMLLMSPVHHYVVCQQICSMQFHVITYWYLLNYVVQVRDSELSLSVYYMNIYSVI